MPAPATPPMFMPMLKPCAPDALAQRPHRPFGVPGQLGGLRLVEAGVVGHVPVGAHHEVPGVVGVEVQHGEDQVPRARRSARRRR